MARREFARRSERDFQHRLRSSARFKTDSNVLAKFNDAAAASGKDRKHSTRPSRPPHAAISRMGRRSSRSTASAGDQQLFADLAMRLFGVHLLSMTYLFLLLMGISTLAFTARYSDRRLLFVPLQFVALTQTAAMQLTPSHGRTNARPGRIRSGGIDSLSSWLFWPALHIFFELSDGVGADRREILKHGLLLSVQILLLCACPARAQFRRLYAGADDLRRRARARMGSPSWDKPAERRRQFLLKFGYTAAVGLVFPRQS